MPAMPITVDSTNAVMNLFGGLFAFLAVVIPILSGVFRRDTGGVLRSNLLRWLYIGLTLGLPVLGTTCLIVLHAYGFALLCYAGSAIVFTYVFLRSSGPPSRSETVLLVLQWAALTCIALFDILSRVLDMLSNVVTALAKH